MAVFGEMLRDVRQRVGWTQEELADRAAISVRSLRDLEAGRVSKPRMRSVRLLADALGLTDHERRRLQAAAAPAPSTQPQISQLPAGVLNFTGRTTALEQLNGLVSAAADHRTMVVSTVSGAGGAGKTALVVHWAHRVVDQFPDGQLYVNLRGFAPGQAPMEPTDALSQFLRALGVPRDQVPSDVDEQASLFRSILAERRMLVVLDNAASADQVRPLLPGRGSCISVITSRDRLTGLVTREGAVPLQLDVLAPPEARELMHRLLGTERVAREPEACEQLIRLCDFLPLALRVVGASLAMTPARSLANAVEQLSMTDRLDALSVTADPASSVPMAFELSYQRLDDDVRAMFRRLALIPGSDFGLHAAASLVACDVVEAERLVSRLVDLNLVEIVAPGRFSLHDLARLFARRCVEHESDRMQPTQRLLDYYLHTAETANSRLRPSRSRPAINRAESGTAIESFVDYEGAFRWCEAELANLTAVVRFAADHGFERHAMQLPTCLIDFYMVHTPWSHWIVTHKAALEAAVRLGDRTREGILLRDLGLAYRDLREFDQAREHYARAVAIGREDSDPMPLARALSSLGILYMDLNENEAAIPVFDETREIALRLDDSYGAMLSAYNLGYAYMRLQRNDLADHCFAEALSSARALGDRRVEAGSTGAIAHLLRKRGRLPEALERLRQCLKIEEETGDRRGLISVHTELSSLLRDLDEVIGARGHLQAALDLARDLGDPRLNDIERELSSLVGKG